MQPTDNLPLPGPAWSKAIAEDFRACAQCGRGYCLSDPTRHRIITGHMPPGYELRRVDQFVPMIGGAL